MKLIVENNIQTFSNIKLLSFSKIQITNEQL